MTYLLSEAGNSMVAVDVEYKPLDKIMDYIMFPQSCIFLKPEQLHKKVLFSSFDYIIALDVLEHIENLEETILLLHKLLKKNGEVIISGPTENFVYKIGRYFAGKHFIGEYHKHSVYSLKNRFAATADVKTLATLYYPLPLFKIFSARFFNLDD
jgi:2-polyprenyl-3-methyl-5-hydroxy-6-metoxy-1,4-benzoquinol methylase